MDEITFDFGLEVYSGQSESVEIDGFTITATVHHDDDATPPWEREDGHGPVSDWRRHNYHGHYSKAPGELMLCEGRGVARFYDFAEACKIALRDGWGAPGDDGMTPRQKASHAAQADFDRLRRWCNNQWSYVKIAVTIERHGVKLTGDYDHTLWDIESDCGEYVADVASELSSEALDAARAKLKELVAQ